MIFWGIQLKKNVYAQGAGNAAWKCVKSSKRGVEMGKRLDCICHRNMLYYEDSVKWNDKAVV